MPHMRRHMLQNTLWCVRSMYKENTSWSQAYKTIWTLWLAGMHINMSPGQVFNNAHISRTYLTVTLVDKSWRSPGWKSCASFSPNVPQALRKTFRLSWTKNKAGMRVVRLQRQRINAHKILWQGHSLQLKVHITREQSGQGGACV